MIDRQIHHNKKLALMLLAVMQSEQEASTSQANLNLRQFTAHELKLNPNISDLGNVSIDEIFSVAYGESSGFSLRTRRGLGYALGVYILSRRFERPESAEQLEQALQQKLPEVFARYQRFIADPATLPDKSPPLAKPSNKAKPTLIGDIGSPLQELRKKLKISRQKLSTETGIYLHTLTQYESEQRDIPSDKFLLILKALGYPDGTDPISWLKEQFQQHNIIAPNTLTSDMLKPKPNTVPDISTSESQPESVVFSDEQLAKINTAMGAFLPPSLSHLKSRILASLKKPPTNEPGGPA